jgi:hypothetical protein
MYALSGEDRDGSGAGARRVGGGCAPGGGGPARRGIAEEGRTRLVVLLLALAAAFALAFLVHALLDGGLVAARGGG